MLNSGFGPTAAFRLFKQFGKPDAEGCVLVSLVQHPAVSTLSSTCGEENNTLIVAYHRSPYEKKKIVARCALFL